jgi:hypothetical protein
MHLKLLSYSATAPSTGAAAAAFTGDSLTIENSTGKVRVLAMWANNQVVGTHQIVYPSGHDTTRNWKTVVDVLNPNPRNVLGSPWFVEPQELLSITIVGSAVAGDVETGHLLLHYANLPGVSSRHMTWPQFLDRCEKQITVQASIAGSGAGYSGTELINADSDLMMANRDYAVLGIETTTTVGAVWLQGPDTGNVKVGVPGNSARPEVGGNWFAGLSRAYDDSLIPIINSGNRNNTQIGIAMNENAAATVVSLNLGLLKRGGSND